MKLKPFAEIIALSKEKLSEALAPIRARKVRSQAELEMAKLDDEVFDANNQRNGRKWLICLRNFNERKFGKYKKIVEKLNGNNSCKKIK